MWNEKDNPPRIERRFEFENYSKTSLFMKDIDNLCKSTNIFPNISFRNKFVGITIIFERANISNEEKEFSMEINDIFAKMR